MMKIKHLYIHVPFCRTICSYCDFCHTVYKDDIVDKWLDRLRKEFDECEDEEYETIYIGGGTPSSLSLKELDTLLNLISNYSHKVVEYTIEINPETIDLDKVLLLKKYGINRVSIGLESSSDKLLKLMNRHHTFLDVENVVKMFKDNGINNISLDILYSLPTQTMSDLKKTLNDALLLDVPHLSLYSLTIEENTIFAKKGLNKLDDELEAKMYEYIVETLKKNNYIQYEIANFSKKGYESKHNLGYWRYEDFRGLSCGSSSKINNKRYDKTRDINLYLNSDKIISEIYDLSQKDLMFEHLMMSLRTLEGLDLIDFNNRYNANFIDIYKDALKKNENNIIIDSNHLIIKNREILNTILLDFLD